MAFPHAHEYTLKSYWEERFRTEASFDWLCTFSQIHELIAPFLGDPSTSRVLILGNGTSPLPLELAAAGFSRVTATDYVGAVVDAMRARPAGAPVAWAVADMLALPASGLGAFDVVIDKGAMDAIVSAEGDSWQPRAEALAASRAVCSGVAALLAKGGVFLQVSFSQPHFRSLHLLQRCGGGGDVPPPPPPPPPLQGDGSDGEFEPDLSPGARQPFAPRVEGSLWRAFEVLRVNAGLGYFCYVMHV